MRSLSVLVAVLLVVVAIISAKVLTPPARPVEPRLIAPNVRGFGLSPDGTRIAYLDPSGLNVANVSTGETKLLVSSRVASGGSDTPAGQERTGERLVSWSPDATRIAFEFTSSAKEARVLLCDASSGSLRVLETSPIVMGLGWSPDGSTLAWCRNLGERTMTHDGHYREQLVLCRSDTERASPKAILTQQCERPAWTGDGKQLVFSADRKHLGIVGSDGSGLRLIGANVGKYEHVSIEYSPITCWSVSQDGKRIAYGSTRRIYVYDIASQHHQEVSSDHTAQEICWSPDSGSLIFGTGGSMGFGFYPAIEVYSMGARGGGARLLGRDQQGITRIACGKRECVYYITWRGLSGPGDLKVLSSK